jgi:Putative glycolipid-binding
MFAAANALPSSSCGSKAWMPGRCRGPPGRPAQPVLRSDGEGRWTVDGEYAPHLDGLLDVGLEASACTNTLPIHRLSLPRGEVTEAPAAYVRALDLSVTRLDQTYRPLDDRRYDHTSEGGTFVLCCLSVCPAVVAWRATSCSERRNLRPRCAIGRARTARPDAVRVFGTGAGCGPASV